MDGADHSAVRNDVEADALRPLLATEVHPGRTVQAVRLSSVLRLSGREGAGMTQYAGSKAGLDQPETILLYRTLCKWCILHRPGCAPNYVKVAVPNSDGICSECAESMTAYIRRRRAEREASK